MVRRDIIRFSLCYANYMKNSLLSHHLSRSVLHTMAQVSNDCLPSQFLPSHRHFRPLAFNTQGKLVNLRPGVNMKTLYTWFVRIDKLIPRKKSLNLPNVIYTSWPKSPTTGFLNNPSFKSFPLSFQFSSNSMTPNDCHAKRLSIRHQQIFTQAITMSTSRALFSSSRWTKKDKNPPSLLGENSLA